MIRKIQKLLKNTMDIYGYMNDIKIKYKKILKPK